MMSDVAGNGTRRSRCVVAAAATLWLVVPALYLVLEALAATAYPTPYSYGRNYISDLGVPARSPRADLMNIAFCLQGAAFVIGAALLVIGLRSRRPWVFLGCAVANAVGNLLVATVHGGPAEVAGGPPLVHATGAVLAIAGGNAAAIAGATLVGDGRWYRSISRCLGAVGLLSLLMFWLGASAVVTVVPAATWERAGVYSILGWQVLTSVYLMRAASVRRLRKFCGASAGDTHGRGS